MILGQPTRRFVYDEVSGREVEVGRADVHCSGTPCVHDSAYGLHEKQHGRDSYIFLIYIRQRMDLKEPWWVSENVPGHSDQPYHKFLGDIYDIEVIHTSPEQEGWSIRRPRIYIVGRLKALTPRVWKTPGFEVPMDTIYHMLLDRQCAHSPKVYQVATEAERRRERTWAEGRKKVLDLSQASWFLRNGSEF